MVQHVLSMLKALGSIPSKKIKNKTKQNNSSYIYFCVKKNLSTFDIICNYNILEILALVLN